MAEQSSSSSSIQKSLDKIVEIDRKISSSIRSLKVISLQRFKEMKDERRGHVKFIQSKGYKE